MDGLSTTTYSSTIVFSRDISMYRCPPEFNEATAGAPFTDLVMDDGFTVLAFELLTWLLNIQPGYHVFCKVMDCWLHPYTPSRFARQLGYNQIFAGNANPKLSIRGTL